MYFFFAKFVLRPCSGCIKLSLCGKNCIIGTKTVNYFVFSDDDWSESNSVPKKKKSKRNSADSALNSPQKMQKEGMLGFYKVFYM